MLAGVVGFLICADGAAVVDTELTPPRGSALPWNRPVAARRQASGQGPQVGDRLIEAGIVIARAFTGADRFPARWTLELEME